MHVRIIAVDIRPAAGCDFVLIFVRHFLFAHVKCLTLFRAGCTRLDMEAQLKCFQVGNTFSSYYKNISRNGLTSFNLLIYRDSRTPTAAAKRALKVVERHFTIQLFGAAYFRWEKHKSEGSGVRPR